MALNSYSTGTISIGANATAVVGVGTLWNEANARAGDTLIVAGHQVLIEDNTDATHLVIDAWPFSAVAGGTAYKIVHTSPLRFAGAQAMIDVDNLVSALDTDGYVVVVKATETVPNPSYGNENQFAFQWGTGKLWTKSGGVWVLVGIFKGFTPRGSWSGATAYVIGDIVTSAGSSYLCVADHTNHVPPNVTYWQLLTSTPWGTPAAWVTATAYSATAPASVVTQGGATYVCIVSHTSGTFATDLAASKWLKISGNDGTNGGTGPAPWSVPVAWVTATPYVVGPPASVVVQGGESYVCLVSHTSGTFATDLAASKWIKITQKGTSDLLASNNLSDVANAATAAGNLSAVRYAAQSLTANQRAQARANIAVIKRNYIENGSMMISQENGITAGTTNGYYPVDRFFLNFSGTTGVVSVAQVASQTPGGSPNRLRATVTTADASVAASDLVSLVTRLEGLSVSDLKFGTASPKDIILSFGVKAPAGTYCIALRNAAPDRAWIGEYVISGGEANTDVRKSVTLTADNTGTWLKDTGIGLQIHWTLMVGSSAQSSTGWQAASGVTGTSNQFNFMGTLSNVFELFDVALYEGNVDQEYLCDDYSSMLQKCMRQFETSAFAVSQTAGAQSGRYFQWNVPFKTIKRATPSVSFSGTSSLRFTFVGAVNVNTEKLGISGTNTDTTGDDFNLTTRWIANARL